MHNRYWHWRYADLEHHYRKTHGRCHLCGRRVVGPQWFGRMDLLGGEAPTIDHLIPQSLDGDDFDGNLMLAHARCNSSRGARPVREARLALSGRAQRPASTAEVEAISASFAALFAVAAGWRFASWDLVGQRWAFNWTAASVAAVLAKNLARVQLDGPWARRS